uniref:Cyclic di-GMP-binding protein n=2 Tax=Alloyangia mangrovi TaxID=1779329 RepID=A0A2A3JW95_9RHOB
MKHWILPILTAALLPAFAGGGRAQQILLNELPVQEAPLAPSERSAESAVPRMDWSPAAPAATAEVTDMLPVLLPLRPTMPQGAETEGYRVQGQFGEARFVLFLPSAAEGAELELTTLSSINLLPEQSNIRVEVNGTTIGTIIPDNFDKAGTDALAIPGGALKPGRNVVTLRFQQVHRVFCGPDAAFDLWTHVLLSQSGIRVAPGDFGADAPGFLAAVAAQLGRGKPLVVAETTGSTDVASLSSAMARVESLFEGLPPEIEITDPYAVATTPPALARVTLLPDETSPPDLPQFRRGGDGALVLVANAAHPEQVAEVMLGAFGEGHPANPVPTLQPGTTRSLADLGVGRLVGQGHYIRETVRFRLPWDWLVLSAQRAELRLDYGFDRNLPKGALLLVKINDATVHLLPLDEDDKAGQRVETLRIPFAANMLEPGVNHLTFEALVPGDPPDEACAPRSTPIFEIFDTTTLDIPTAPSMSVARLDQVLAGLSPESVRLSEAAGEALPLGLLPRLASVFVGQNTEGPGPASLTIGVPSDLSTLGGRILGDATSTLQEAMLIAPRPEPKDIDTWAKVDGGRWWQAVYDPAKAGAIVRTFRDRLAAIWRGPQSELDAWLDGRAADAMLLQPDLDRPGNIWLILRPNLPLEKLVASLIHGGGTLDIPRGQVSLFTPDAGWQSWHSSARRLELHEPLTLDNARKVVGNYASLAPPVFIVPMLALSLVSAILAMGVMIITRRRKK